MLLSAGLSAQSITLSLIAVLYVSFAVSVQAQTPGQIEQLNLKLQALENQIELRSGGIENQLGTEVNRLRGEVSSIQSQLQDSIDGLQDDLAWYKTVGYGIAFIITTIGASGWGIFTTTRKRVQGRVDALEKQLNERIDQRAEALDNQLEKRYIELLQIIEGKDEAIRALIKEGDVVYRSRMKGKILVLCRDEQDEHHVRDLMERWEFPPENITYTPLGKKVEGDFDLVVLDDHDKENIPVEVLVESFNNYPDAYFVLYVNYRLDDLSFIPKGTRYNFANSHETLKNRIIDALKEQTKPGASS